MTLAYEEGKVDRRLNKPEPKPSYVEGSQKYKDYVAGFLGSVLPKRDNK